MEEIKVGSIVTTSIAIGVGRFRLKCKLLGIVLSTQGESAVVFTLNKGHKYITKNLYELKLSNSVLNHRLSITEIDRGETRQIVTITLKEKGYDLTYTKVKIIDIDKNHGEIFYREGEDESVRLNLNYTTSLGCNYNRMDSFKCVI